MKSLLIIISIFVSSISQAAGRDWSVDGRSLVNILLTNSISYDNGTSENETGQELEVEFGRNLGVMEYGPTLGYANASSTVAPLRKTAFGGYFRYNFLENRPGSKYIPYVRVHLLMINEDRGGVTNDVTLIGLSSGLSWFPLNDVVGLSGYLAYQDAKITGAKINSLSLSTALTLYF